MGSRLKKLQSVCRDCGLLFDQKILYYSFQNVLKSFKCSSCLKLLNKPLLGVVQNRYKLEITKLTNS